MQDLGPIEAATATSEPGYQMGEDSGRLVWVLSAVPAGSYFFEFVAGEKSSGVL